MKTEFVKIGRFTIHSQKRHIVQVDLMQVVDFTCSMQVCEQAKLYEAC